jgi:hypothetical protein
MRRRNSARTNDRLLRNTVSLSKDVDKLSIVTSLRLHRFIAENRIEPIRDLWIKVHLPTRGARRDQEIVGDGHRKPANNFTGSPQTTLESDRLSALGTFERLELAHGFILIVVPFARTMLWSGL